MKEIKEIVEAYEAARAENKQTALATVVQVQGSSYRRPGARMLVTEDGQLTGAISGGCLEGDALRKARMVMARQKPMLVTYDTTDEDDAQLGVGLGCNGIIQILIEPIQPQTAHNPIQLLKSFLSQRQQAVIVTLFSLESSAQEQPGTCLLLPQKANSQGTCRPSALHNIVLADAAQVLEQQQSLTKTYLVNETKFTGFIELLQPAVSVVIAGAGNDVQPLVQISKVMGWEVTVVDGRPNYASAVRFPAADQVLVAKPDQVLEKLEIVDAQTVFLLMTHNYNYDIRLLQHLIPLNIKYVGVLGPKKKLNRMLDQLIEEGVKITHEQLEKVYGPVGLEIGAETSEEIALSIISEIKAVFAHKTGTPLRDKPDAIHARSAPEEMTEILPENSTARFACSN